MVCIVISLEKELQKLVSCYVFVLFEIGFYNARGNTNYNKYQIYPERQFDPHHDM